MADALGRQEPVYLRTVRSRVKEDLRMEAWQGRHKRLNHDALCTDEDCGWNPWEKSWLDLIDEFSTPGPLVMGNLDEIAGMSAQTALLNAHRLMRSDITRMRGHYEELCHVHDREPDPDVMSVYQSMMDMIRDNLTFH